MRLSYPAPAPEFLTTQFQAAGDAPHGFEPPGLSHAAVRSLGRGMTGNVLLKVQPQFPGQDPGVSAVQPGTLMARAPTWARPQLHSSFFFANLGPLPQPRTVGHLGLPSAHRPLLQCLPHRFQPHLCLSAPVVQAVLVDSVPLCHGREKAGWVGEGMGIPHKLPCQGAKSSPFSPPPENGLPHLFPPSCLQWEGQSGPSVSLGRSLCQICLRVYICGKTLEALNQVWELVDGNRPMLVSWFAVVVLNNLFNFGCAESVLLCKLCSGCGEWGLLSSCRVGASEHLRGFSCCRARVLGCSGCSTAVPGLWSTGSVAPCHVESSQNEA